MSFSATSKTTAEQDSSFRHALYPYRGDAQFLTGTLSFIHEALTAGEAIIIAVPSDKASLLHDELRDEPAVTFVETSTVGANPGRHIAAWTAWMSQHGEEGRPVRGIGETAWRQARNAAHLSELRYNEWLLNRAFASSRAWSMLCPYDAADEDPAALRSVSRCHPLIHQDGQVVPNDGYLSTDDYAFDALPDACDPYQELVYTSGDLSAVRSKVSQCASDAGVHEDQLPKLAVAVTEIATNSIRHGGGQGTLRTWAQDATFLCEFRDSGFISDQMVGRVRPTSDQIGGRGLWLAHQLCDLVEIRSTREQGTTIRLHMDIPR
ncbi:anti-sigma factor RsbA family regulatory protein [Streptomyces sp. NPDC006530]|uniref:anti-sigma factor RsbA family regulatory protein n=1 Tax=Streptomyces sp. NPDC006530 TaxID=3364750 RepID=UPI0036A14644